MQEGNEPGHSAAAANRGRPLPGLATSGPATVRTALFAVVATAGTLLISPYIASAIARGYGWFVGLGEARGYLPGELERLLMIQEAIYQGAFDCILILLTLLAVRVLSKQPAKFLALISPSRGALAYGEAVAIVAVAAALWFAFAFQLFPDDATNDIRPYRQLMAQETGWLMPPIYCLLAPVAEELLFRGFLFRSLMKSSIGTYGAAILTSAAWMLLHADRSAIGIAQIFALGLLFSYMLVRTGSLRVPIFAHIVFNFGLSVIVFATFSIG